MFECPSSSHRGRCTVGLAFLFVLSACRSFTEPDEGPDGVEPPEGAPSFEAQLSSQLPASMVLPLVSVAAGGAHTCVASANGAVYCWGRNQGGLGADISSDASVHVAVRIDEKEPLGQLTAGEAGLFPDQLGGDGWSRHTCGLASDGSAYCWGSAGFAFVGAGDPDCGPDGGCTVPEGRVFPVAGGLSFEALSAGGGDTCGIATDGRTYCWGEATEQFAPALVSQEPLGLVTLDLGWRAACGLTGEGAVWCWGDNRFAQLGPRTPELDGRGSPPTLLESDLTFVQVTVGGGHACGLARDGAAFCWGRNDEGQLGTGEVHPTCPEEEVSANLQTCRDDPPGPHAVEGDLEFVQIDAGLLRTCGLTPGGEAWCWGRGDEGQLGDGTGVDSSLPVRVDGPFFEHISAGSYHTCGLSAGRAYCWGWGKYGQTGQQSTVDLLGPEPALGQG
jgi:alpha-tubulin suppressor-like RCC1 family protein